MIIRGIPILAVFLVRIKPQNIWHHIYANTLREIFTNLSCVHDNAISFIVCWPTKIGIHEYR